MDRLRFSRRQSDHAGEVVRACQDLGEPRGGVALRRWIAKHGKTAALDAARIMSVVRGNQFSRFSTKAEAELHKMPCLEIRELQLGGDDLRPLGIEGSAIGATLRTLLSAVIDRPTLNRRDTLLHLVNSLCTGKKSIFQPTKRSEDRAKAPSPGANKLVP